ncbi:ligand-binding sensor domain-containing protein [Niabella terrae]
MPKSLLIILCFLFTLCGSAQTFYFRHYQVENGLSNNTTICTLQDRNGFMWFGTKDGLNRFDGYSFKVFRNDPKDSTSLGNNSIWRLYEDASGILWVGTERGLFAYDATFERFTSLPGSPRSEISGISSDQQGHLWFLGGFRLYEWRPESRQLIRHDDPGLEFCTAVSRSAAGDIWVGTIEGRLFQYRENTQQFSSYSLFSHSQPSSSSWVERIYDSGLGFLFIGTSNQGIKIFDLLKKSYTDLLTRNADGSEIYARDFIRTSGYEYWIGTEKGIYIYNAQSGTFTHLTKNNADPYALSDNAVYSFAKDQEGGIWAGTYFGGVNYYARQKIEFEKFFPGPWANSIKGNAIREIRQDDQGNVWIGTEDAGLNVFDPRTKKMINYNPEDGSSNLTHTNIHGLMVDEDRLWIGTFEHGLDIMDLRSRKVIRHYAYSPGRYGLKSNFIHSIFKSAAGTIYVGTSNGLYIYSPAMDNFIPLDFIPQENFFSAITEDALGNIWFGTFRSGVFYYNPKKQLWGRLSIRTSGRNRLTDNRITNLYIDHRQQLWVSTEDGLYRFQPRTSALKTYSFNNGLPSSMIYSVIEDDNQQLWVTTSKGLAQIDPHTNSIRVFTQTDGLLTDQFNYASACKTASGRIYFGSVKGMISFDPQQHHDIEYTPPVYITQIQIHNKDVNISKDGPLYQSLLSTSAIHLSHKQASISIDFAALNFSSPQSIQYAYQLEGIDETWNYIKQNRRVYFTNLPAGNYRFLLASTNGDGNWTSERKSLQIIIDPPWWLSKIAYLAYILATLALTWWIISFFHNRQVEKHRVKMADFERKKEKEFYESKLDFFTKIAHEIRTPLTLIKAPMEKIMKQLDLVPQLRKHLQTMNKNTGRLISLTNQLLDFRKMESGNYQTERRPVHLSELAASIFEDFHPLAAARNISYQFSDPQGNIIALIDEEATRKILSNLLDNGLKYGQHFLEMQLAVTEKQAIVRVLNDGPLIDEPLRDKIFEPFYRTNDTQKIIGTGIGLPLARSLAALQQGELFYKPEGRLNCFVLVLNL